MNIKKYLNTRRQEEAEQKKIEAEKKPLIDIAIECLDDESALKVIPLYPAWESLVKESHIAEKAGFRFSYNEKLYKTLQDSLTFSEEWIPGKGTESLYARIDETHDGSETDPIPYDGNMELTSGLYYTQDGVLYLCNRDTGNPVHNALAELVGLYVEVVA